MVAPPSRSIVNSGRRDFLGFFWRFFLEIRRKIVSVCQGCLLNPASSCLIHFSVLPFAFTLTEIINDEMYLCGLQTSVCLCETSLRTFQDFPFFLIFYRSRLFQK